ncbi:MAG: DsrE family protein [Methanothrix sp.]|nr:DsrE family protein [Methanothrix sp.]
MRSFFLLESAPYGSERAFGLLNAAAVCTMMEVEVGLYGDGVYLALAGQRGEALGVPGLSDMLYAYPEVSFLAHEPSLKERGLMEEALIERVELLDDDRFLDRILGSDALIVL